MMLQRTHNIFKIPKLLLQTSLAFATAAQSKQKKTLYQILQVPSTAPQSNIRKNYLKLAKVFHPDVYKGSDKGRFQQVQKAYQTLSDVRKRQQYDEQIGIRKKSHTQSEQFKGTYDKASDQQVNKRNDFKYEAAQQQKIDLDAEYEKFFRKKKQTDFEDVRLHEQTQFREMNQKQRIRFSFRQLYTNDAAQLKIKQTQSFQQLLDDQIQQRNTHYEDIKKKKQRVQKINSQQSIKKQKILVYLLAIVGAMIFYPLFFSFWTKYKLQRQEKFRIQELIEEIKRKQQEAEVRSRFQY